MITWKRKEIPPPEEVQTVLAPDMTVLKSDPDEIYLARRRLEDVLNPERAEPRDARKRKSADEYNVIGRGARCLVLEMSEIMVAKVDHAPSTNRERRERRHFQQNCDFFFGADAVVEEYMPPQHGSVQTVSFQKNMKKVLQDPRTVIFASGYAEEHMPDGKAYANVSSQMMKPDGKFDEDGFRLLYGNKHMLKVLDTMKKDTAFRERLDQMISEIIYMIQKIKKGFDFMGYENILLHPDAQENEWMLSILDPHLDVQDKLIPFGKKTLEIFQRDPHHLPHMYKAHLVNFINLVRVLNSFAAYFNYPPEERISIGDSAPDWDQLLHTLHTFVERIRNIQRERKEEPVGSIMPTVMQTQARMLEAMAGSA